MSITENRRELSEKRRQQYEEFAQLRLKDRLTYKECAEIMKVSVRTLKRWINDEEFLEIWRELKRQWRESAQSSVEEAGKRAVEVMLELMDNPRVTPHVRYEAAKAVGDWAGLGKFEDKEKGDDRDVLKQLYSLIEQNKQNQTTYVLVNGTRVETQPALQEPAVDAEFNELNNELKELYSNSSSSES